MEIFRDVVISTTDDGPGRAAVDVSVADTWSTVINADIHAGGGRTTGSVTLTELNLVGTGKHVLASYGVGLDRISRAVGYEDPQLFGSRWQAGGEYRDTSDGLDVEGGFGRPFHSIEDPWSVESRAHHQTLTGKLFTDGAEVSRHDWRRDRGFAAVAWRAAGGPGWALRPGLRYRYESDVFFRVPGTSPGLFPSNREFNWLLAELEWVRPRYIRDRRLDTMGKVEEFDLGWRMKGRAGAGFLSAALSRGIGPRGGPYLMGTAEGATRIESGEARQATVSGRLIGYDHLTSWQTLVLSGAWREGRNLDKDTQFLLGGDSGLRGYPVRRFDGSRSFLGAIEDRVTLADNVLSIFSFGLAVFADTGYAWREGQVVSFADLKSDVGGGLRFAFPRGPYGATLRFDAAYALNEVPGVTDRWFLSIGFGPTF